MANPVNNLPPHIALLLSEEFQLDDPRSVRKQLKGMARDLRDQAEIAPTTLLDYSDNTSEQFNVVLSGGLDLFAGEGACQAAGCRVRYVDQVARSIALMADQVTLHDFLHASFIDLPSRPTEEQIDRLVPDLYVLKRLGPLLEAGVVSFVSPFMPYCEGCIGKFEAEVEATTDALLQQLGDSVGVERVDGEVVIDTGPMYEPPLMLAGSIDKANGLSDAELLRNIARDAVRKALWDARDASLTNGVVFSNSRLGASGLLYQEGQRLDEKALSVYSARRAAELPWVRGLSVAQTLQLREEASTALPALRAFLARRLASRPHESSGSGGLELIEELREQAIDVRSELEIASTKSKSLRRNATGVVGLGIAALSVAVESSPLPAVASLLTTLGLIHQMPAPDTEHVQRLRARPGYVLVAAADILEHASTDRDSR